MIFEILTQSLICCHLKFFGDLTVGYEYPPDPTLTPSPDSLQGSAESASTPTSFSRSPTLRQSSFLPFKCTTDSLPGGLLSLPKLPPLVLRMFHLGPPLTQTAPSCPITPGLSPAYLPITSFIPITAPHSWQPVTLLFVSLCPCFCFSSGRKVPSGPALVLSPPIPSVQQSTWHIDIQQVSKYWIKTC